MSPEAGPERPQVSDLLARELVPGDIVELHTGDRVPADLRLLSLNTATLRAEQASLTGEAVAVQKVRRICRIRLLHSPSPSAALSWLPRTYGPSCCRQQHVSTDSMFGWEACETRTERQSSFDGLTG